MSIPILGQTNIPAGIECLRMFSQQLEMLPEGVDLHVPTAADLGQLISSLNVLQPQRILEIGTGCGLITFCLGHYSSANATVDTLYDTDQVIGPQQAKKVLDRVGLNHKVRFHLADFSIDQLGVTSAGVTELPILDSTKDQVQPPFDFIVLSRFDSELGLRRDLEMAERSLAPGGVIVLSRTLLGQAGLFARREVFKFVEGHSAYTFVHDRSSLENGELGFLRHYQPGAKRYDVNAVYTEEFFEQSVVWHDEGVPYFCKYLIDAFKPSSVIDLGCGAGMWLLHLHSGGVVNLIGLEGSKEGCEFARGRLGDMAEVIEYDLRQEFRPTQRVDLCLCLDVIEHIEPEYADALIQSCVNSSDTVIFSSPPPGQSGDNHINERPLAHWVEKFLKHGYLIYDVIRPAFEDSTQVHEMTYSNNAVVFKRVMGAESLEQIQKILPELPEYLRHQIMRLEDIGIQNLILKLSNRAIENSRNLFRDLHTQSTQHQQEVLEGIRLERLQLRAEDIIPEEGCAYQYCYKSDALRILGRAVALVGIKVFEDGRELPLGKQAHQHIRELGGGRYSVWDNQIFLTATDNSDPRTNGRSYEVEVPGFVRIAEEAERLTSATSELAANA